VTKRKTTVRRQLPGQVVLVLQGGGALGAYQVGVYQALHEAGIEPDWIVGTSIGAVNGALIAGNVPERRIARLTQFWADIEQHFGITVPGSSPPVFGNAVSNLATVATGIPGFFMPNPMLLLGQHARVGTENAAYYTTTPLHRTLTELVDFDYINERHARLSLGAVNVRTGEMTYFDSRDEDIAMEHVMASSAYPPAFPAVQVNGEFYWDGGIYSNTPIEAVLDDNPRRDSLIFTVDVWNPAGTVPETLWQVAGREKEISYASRTSSHLARQKQIHHLRHVIQELAKTMQKKTRSSNRVRELTSWGCQTTMHVVRLVANGIAGEDHLKDIDFTPSGIDARWRAGFDHAQRILETSPWDRPVDPVEGIVIHDASEDRSATVAAGIDGFSGKTK
jgi:NTE family protein